MEICSMTKQLGVERAYYHELYCTWRMMNYRCYSDVHTSFKAYGGLGISVSEDWRWDNPAGLFNFLQDMSVRPDKFTLDRIDPYGNYSLDNCRWADKKTQQNNFRREKDTKSGHLGVVKDSQGNSGKWSAQIFLHGVMLRINLYDDLQEAIAARERVLAIKVEQGEDAALAYLKENTIITVMGKRFYGRKTSRYYGVSWQKCKCRWRATVARRVDGKLKQLFLGTFLEEEDANNAVLAFLEREKNESSI
jgi:hypothetical protein